MEVPENFCAVWDNVTDRYMQDVLGAIFEQLDQQSLQNAELVSNKWKMAIADGNPSKLWDKFLHEKVWLY